MPLIRRVPKRGFYNPFGVDVKAVNVSALEKALTRARRWTRHRW